MVVHQLADSSLYSWTFFEDTLFGLASRPTDMVYCPGLLVAFSEGLQSWLGGLASLVLALVLLCVFFLVWFLGNYYVSVICFSRDWPRCRAALGAKKQFVWRGVAYFFYSSYHIVKSSQP